MNIQSRHDLAAATICATNYLGKALALRESYLEHNPNHDFYILIVDKKHDRLKNLPSEIQLLWVEDLGIDGFPHYAFKFDVIELNTNVKPTLLLTLLHSHTKVIYLDPDIAVYSSMNPVFDELDAHSIVVTPTSMTPVNDGKAPADVEFLRFGSFNLGFVGISRSEEGIRFLNWWSDRCLEHGYYEPQLGLAVDQKWIDLAPPYFPGLKIIRDPGLNVAFFNLHERFVTKHDGVWMVNENYPLKFFHFSSFSAKQPHAIAHKQSRFAPDSRPDLHELLDTYAAQILALEHDSYSSVPYTFDYFDDGTFITPSLRRFYAALESKFPQAENPFHAGSAVERFAFAQGLAGDKYKSSARPTFKELGHFSRQARVISFLLRQILRIVGPNQYFSLMRYMAYISSIRNQADLFEGKL